MLVIIITRTQNTEAIREWTRGFMERGCRVEFKDPDDELFGYSPSPYEATNYLIDAFNRTEMPEAIKLVRILSRCFLKNSRHRVAVLANEMDFDDLSHLQINGVLVGVHGGDEEMTPAYDFLANRTEGLMHDNDHKLRLVTS
jgi:hypothetical protein